MPAPELKATVMGTVSENRTVGSTRTDTDTLLDLEGDVQQAGTGAATSPVARTQNTQDLLADIFGTAPAAPTAQPPPAGAPKSVNDILGLFGGPANGISGSPAPTQANPYASPPPASNPLFSLDQPSAPASVVPQAAQPPAQVRPAAQSYSAYDNHELKIFLTPQVSAARLGIVNIMARFQVTGANTATNVNFQAAVPRTQQLQMLPMSNQTVVPGATETQQLRVTAPPGASVRLRLRIGFSIAGQTFQDQVDFSGFPANLTTGGQ